MISVVLPTFNRAHLVQRAIRSVLDQSFADVELIVVDDASTDNTAEIVSRVRDSRLIYVQMQQNGGAASARNVGIARATGDFVAFQDSDDYWMPDFLDCLHKILSVEDESYGVAYCGKIIYGRSDCGVFGSRRSAYMPSGSRVSLEGDIYLSLLHDAQVSTQTMLVRRDVFESVGSFSDGLRIGVDWEWTLRAAKQYKFCFVEKPMAITFVEGDSVTHQKKNSVRTIEEILRIHNDVLASYPKLRSSMYQRLARGLRAAKQNREARAMFFRAWQDDYSNVRALASVFIGR